MGLGTPIILMHGWGGSNVSFAGTYEYLCGLNRDVVSIDFPGFGSSDLPPSEWGLEDYAACVSELRDALKLRKAILVGHSFGGRVALFLGSEPWVESLVLVDAAGLKPRFSLKRAYRIRKYKRAKRLGKDLTSYGSIDYLKLPQSMQPVFVRVVNTHLNDKLGSITCPVLIIWGKRDSETPMYMAHTLKRRIADSTLVVLQGGHFAYIESNLKFNLILAEFTKGGKECLFGS